jgi:hypothetical protein
MDFIYIKKKSLSTELCDEIIGLYHKNNHAQYQGITFAGVNTNVKDSIDLNISGMARNDKTWEKIHKILYLELYDNLKTYLNKFNDDNRYYKNMFDSSEFKIIETTILVVDSFQMQRYEKKKGKYIYHNDSLVSYDTPSFRVITFLWYLNDVYEGGETEFWGGDLKIIPECGKLLLFPATWTYPHCANIPISNDKYIITGWLNISMTPYDPKHKIHDIIDNRINIDDHKI